jgi:hypothetical protein
LNSAGGNSCEVLFGAFARAVRSPESAARRRPASRPGALCAERRRWSPVQRVVPLGESATVPVRLLDDPGRAFPAILGWAAVFEFPPRRQVFRRGDHHSSGQCAIHPDASPRMRRIVI